MGFWHTGYMEFHEPITRTFTADPPAPPVFSCQDCSLGFRSLRDLRVHRLQGSILETHERPILVFRGRECGRSRLNVTTESTSDDWRLKNARIVKVNGKTLTSAGAAEFLAAQRTGVTDVVLESGAIRQGFEFEFALADESDLEGVDAALGRLIASGELSLRSIDTFIQRSRPFRSSGRYMAGIANYFYGVLEREGMAEAASSGHRSVSDYESKYDQSVNILGNFDRDPAEAICGIVAFHYNQFERSATKTSSERVADVSLRFQAIISGQRWSREDLSQRSFTSLDRALTDSALEEVLRLSSVALDGSSTSQLNDVMNLFESRQLRPADEFKLRLIAAEHFLASGDLAEAERHASHLRHGRNVEGWYEDFTTRASKRGKQ